MIGNTKLYLAPKDHGTVLYGCAPTVGGWWTDMWNAIEKGGSTSLNLWNKYITGQATAEAIESGKAATPTSTDTLVKYAVIAGLGLLAVVALKKA